jgi:hypothetical protein
MATRHADPTAPGYEGLAGALGGAPLPEPEPPAADDDKAARKHRKHDAKLRRDAERPPDSFERFRVLAELVNEGRRVVELVDHKARYALVVMGAVNTGAFVLVFRMHLFESIPQEARPWLIGFIAIYAALSFFFVFYAVDCLRPRRLRYADVMTINGSSSEPGNPHAPRGILFWETIANYELDAYRRAWSSIRMEQLNAEVVVIAHQQAGLIRAKYRALGRLFWGLTVQLVLAGLLVGMCTLFGLAR